MVDYAFEVDFFAVLESNARRTGRAGSHFGAPVRRRGSAVCLSPDPTETVAAHRGADFSLCEANWKWALGSSCLLWLALVVCSARQASSSKKEQVQRSRGRASAVALRMLVRLPALQQDSMTRWMLQSSSEQQAAGEAPVAIFRN